MKTRTLLCIGAAAFLWGCAIAPPDGRALEPCNTEICQIQVTVDDSQTPPKITVDLPILTIAHDNHGRNNKGVKIHWVLTSSPRYTFREDSIQFYDPRSPGQFSTDHPVSNNGNTAEWIDQNTDGLKWGYQIKVYHRQSGVWIPLDPWIQNG